MNSHTKEFLTKLAELMEEYNANLEIEGDSFGGGIIKSRRVNNDLQNRRLVHH